MQPHAPLDDLERSVYETAYSDGMIDLLFGVSLLWIAAVWIWLPDFAGLAGVLPAVFVPTALPLRKQVLEARGGYVKWSARRRSWERRNVTALVVAGTAVFLVGVGAYVSLDSGLAEDVARAIAPGLLAFILAIGAVMVGFLFETRRALAYAAILVAGGIGASAADSNPGWPMLVAGAVVVAVGATMLVRFLKHNPQVEAS